MISWGIFERNPKTVSTATSSLTQKGISTKIQQVFGNIQNNWN